MRKGTVLDQFLDAIKIKGLTIVRVNSTSLSIIVRDTDITVLEAIVTNLGFVHNHMNYYRKGNAVVSLAKCREGLLLQYNY